MNWRIKNVRWPLKGARKTPKKRKKLKRNPYLHSKIEKNTPQIVKKTKVSYICTNFLCSLYVTLTTCMH